MHELEDQLYNVKKLLKDAEDTKHRALKVCWHSTGLSLQVLYVFNTRVITFFNEMRRLVVCCKARRIGVLRNE